MTNPQSPWVLPAGIDEVLPQQAAHLEQLRGQALNIFDQWGYDLVLPPMVEFLDTLLVGTGADLELDTLKVTDGLSGRLLGVRADMTPQIARMDAHSLPEQAERRLCYVGTVIRGAGDALGGSRAPIQLGGELFGADCASGDHEILDLLLALLDGLEVGSTVLDLGHVGVFRALADKANLSTSQIDQTRDAIARKAIPELDAQLSQWGVADAERQALLTLCRLHGPVEQVIARAKQAFAGLLDVQGEAALARLEQVAGLLQAQHANRHRILVDLSQLQGYHYHTGLVFAGYLPCLGRALVRGGRYDNIGDAFGRARPAIGFSLDLRDISAFAPEHIAKSVPVYAPAKPDDAALRQAVTELRAQGRRVISIHNPQEQVHGARLVQCGDEHKWQLVEDKNDG